MRIVHTAHYKQARRRTRLLNRIGYGMIAFSVIGLVALAIDMQRPGCMPSVHVARQLEVYSHGERTHSWIKTYHNCK